jgi:hypothetical protein
MTTTGLFMFLSTYSICSPGIFLGFSASTPLHLSGFKVAPWAKNISMLHKKDENTVQPVEIHGPLKLKVIKSLINKLTVDKQLNIFQMHHYKAEHGSIFDGVRVYTRMVDRSMSYYH